MASQDAEQPKRKMVQPRPEAIRKVKEQRKAMLAAAAARKAKTEAKRLGNRGKRVEKTSKKSHPAQTRVAQVDAQPIDSASVNTTKPPSDPGPAVVADASVSISPDPVELDRLPAPAMTFHSHGIERSKFTDENRDLHYRSMATFSDINQLITLNKGFKEKAIVFAQWQSIDLSAKVKFSDSFKNGTLDAKLDDDPNVLAKWTSLDGTKSITLFKDEIRKIYWQSNKRCSYIMFYESENTRTLFATPSSKLRPALKAVKCASTLAFKMQTSTEKLRTLALDGGKC